MNNADTLAYHLDKALRRFYGVMDSEDDNYDAILYDGHFDHERWWCPHCGGSGKRRDKVQHETPCWYHEARVVLRSYQKNRQEER